MKRLIVDFVDALIPLAGALLLLAAPQWFTRRDLKATENRKLAKRLRMAGWLLLAAGGLLLVANVGSGLSAR